MSGAVSRLASAALVLAVAGCASARPPAPAVDPCAPGAAAAGWQAVDAGPFSLGLPPGFQRREVQGIDSYVGQWDAPGGRAVSFDYGAWSSSLDEMEAALRDYRECTTEIGGHAVRIVSGFDEQGRIGEGGRKYVVAAAWRSVPPGARLTVVASSRNGADLPALAAILHSVRFDAP